MINNMKYLTLIVFVLFIAGCSKDEDSHTSISSLEAQVSDLEKRLASSEAQAKLLATSIENVQWEVLSKLELESAAIVDPSSKGYAIARNEYGAFPVILEDAQPYLDGHKLKFQIGNLTSAAMTDVKLKIVYGERDPALPTRDNRLSDRENSKAFRQYLDTVEQNKKSRRILTIDAGKDLAPASWNIVEVIISPSKPENLGRIEVSVKAMGMKLSTPR